VSKAAAVKQG